MSKIGSMMTGRMSFRMSLHVRSTYFRFGHKVIEDPMYFLKCEYSGFGVSGVFYKLIGQEVSKALCAYGGFVLAK